MSNRLDTDVRDRLDPAVAWPLDTATTVRAAGLGWLVAAGWLASSGLGLAVGVGLAAVGVLFGPILTVAVAHAALIAVVPELWQSGGVVDLALFEVGLLAVLVSHRPVTPIVGVLTLGGAVALVAGTLAVVLEFGLAAGVIVGIGVAVAGSLLVGRYGQHSLRQAVETPDTQPTSDPSNTQSTGAST